MPLNSGPHQLSPLVFALGLAAACSCAQAQTQAAAPALQVEVLARELEHPWALAFIGDGRMLVTERPGRLRLIQPDGTVGAPIAGVPEVDAVGQGGLLDVVADSDFARNRTVYFCYAEPAGNNILGAVGLGGANSTALAAARLSQDERQLEQVKILFRQQPKVSSRAHFGCRIVENTDGTLFLTLGERFSRMQDAQTLDNHHGKVVRLRKDGSVPPDNPLVGNSAALPEIWSYGHRNMQGAALGPDGRLWTHEHGPQGGDEINRPEAGKNYGWPVITYGENYGGGKIGAGLRAKAGMEQPLLPVDAVDCAVRHDFPAQRALRQGVAGQPVRRLAEVPISGPPRIARWQGGARTAAAARPRPAHPRRARGAGRLAVRIDRRKPRPVAALAAGPLARLAAAPGIIKYHVLYFSSAK